MSPCCSRTHASYRAQAPSASTCDSRIGGHAPIASSPFTNANGCPARKSALPEHVNPISSFGMPDRFRASSTTGMRISTSLWTRSRRTLVCANDTTATSRIEQPLQHLFDGNVRLVDRPEVLDRFHVRSALLRLDPYRLHSHSHAHVAGLDLLEEVIDRDVRAIQKDQAVDVRDRDGTGERHVHDAERR